MRGRPNNPFQVNRGNPRIVRGTARRPAVVPRQVPVRPAPAPVYQPVNAVSTNPGMVVRLQGGLGNQLFQVAFGFSVAKKRGEELYFTRFGVDNDTKRSYSLGPFKCDLKFVPKEGDPIYSEDVFLYDPLVYQRPRNPSFSGHWQTEKYFDVPLVREILAFRNPPSAKTQEVAELIKDAGANSAFLHIRRGDYLWKENLTYHGGCSPGYYQMAIARIKQKAPDTKFFVFSDEPDWCRTAYPNFTIIDHNKPGDNRAPGQEHEDLYLMSLCRHAVIANSSFSWWGAWLGDTQPDRLVIAPKKWFTTPSLQYRDVVPERWIKLDN